MVIGIWVSGAQVWRVPGVPLHTTRTSVTRIAGFGRQWKRNAVRVYTGCPIGVMMQNIIVPETSTTNNFIHPRGSAFAARGRSIYYRYVRVVITEISTRNTYSRKCGKHSFRSSYG